MSEISVEVEETPVVVEVNEGGQNLVEIEIANAGPQGIPGPAGDQGPQGPPGEAGYGGYVHAQGVPASVWTIAHDLAGYPNVTVLDSAGTVVEGDIAYPDSTTVVLTFAAAFSGTAYLS